MKRKFLQKMTGKIPVLVIAAAVLFAGTALAGCNKSEEETTPTTEDTDETASATGGNRIDSEATIVRDVNELSAEEKTMLGPMGALIYTYEDAGNTTPTWDNSGWSAVGELFNYWGPGYVDDSKRVTGDASEIQISEDFLKEAASVMFPDYDDSLPTIDASEETAGFQPEEDGYYPFVFSDRGEGADTFTITYWAEQDDGLCEVIVEATDYQGNSSSYRFVLSPNQNANEAEDPIFYYDIDDIHAEG